MSTFQILSLLGVGSVFSAIAIGIWKYAKKSAQKTATNIKAIMLGLQAVLRAQMINDYNHYKEKGYAPIYAKENFRNCWNQYEALGANGVINHIYNEFLELPTTPPDGGE